MGLDVDLKLFRSVLLIGKMFIKKNVFKTLLGLSRASNNVTYVCLAKSSTAPKQK
jgi:hypothetical protein